MNYYINGQEVNEEKFYGRLEYEVIERSEEDFDNHLDETHEEIKIAGITFYPSRILFELDKIAYETMYTEYVDYILSEYIQEVELLNKLTISGTKFEIVE